MQSGAAYKTESAYIVEARVNERKGCGDVCGACGSTGGRDTGASTRRHDVVIGMHDSRRRQVIVIPIRRAGRPAGEQIKTIPRRDIGHINLPPPLPPAPSAAAATAPGVNEDQRTVSRNTDACGPIRSLSNAADATTYIATFRSILRSRHSAVSRTAIDGIKKTVKYV